MRKTMISFVIISIFTTFACSKKKEEKDETSMYLLTKAEKIQNDPIKIKVSSEHKVKLWGEFTRNGRKYKLEISNKKVSATCGCDIKVLEGQDFEFWVDINKDKIKETNEMFPVTFKLY